MTIAATFTNSPSRMIGIKRVIRHFRFIIGEKQRRIACGLRYALGRSTLMDGYDLMRHGETVTGCYSLEHISVETTVEIASQRWKDFPELTVLAGEAAAHVSYKWNSSGDTAWAATDWAMKLIAEYAAARGIQLQEIDE